MKPLYVLQCATDIGGIYPKDSYWTKSGYITLDIQKAFSFTEDHHYYRDWIESGKYWKVVPLYKLNPDSPTPYYDMYEATRTK